jgi:hypothetical protein
MIKGLQSRLHKLESVEKGGKLAIVFARFASELPEAEAAKALLEAEGREVFMVRWQWDDEQTAIPFSAN